ncbi:MAG TPA: cysteine desulfurase family protein [Bacillota bacterium]|jgi:cysteine desulfurase|nr:cysteine desulfurase family protein [Bacillota bacterium]HOP68989.1 cysteine desulfurase family protein [Bacillota bacterium]HPT34048.1 cysteine desulfurase family protein [Bacillota bacterium]HPZ65342.1 cysteine desulfurase family protein [Bacillota bacterium]HQD05741.1 cysteine desulfurase family protein [Bacillota bacterium]
MEEIYLDNSATTRPLDQVVELMAKIQKEVYGNPSSLHRKGMEAERVLKEARATLAELLQVRQEEIFFTSGGTESNNLAIKGAAYRRRRRGGHIVTTRIEHPSVLNAFRQLEEEGFQATYLTVDRQGYIDLQELEQAITEETILVSIIHANNEIGTLQPVEQIGALVKKRNPDLYFHVDGVQSFGKIPVNPSRWQADLFSFSAHKIHGPKGIGGLWVKQNTLLQPLCHGGDQEQGLRPGTENVAGAAGFALAARSIFPRLEENRSLLLRLKTALYRGLLEEGITTRINGPALEEGAPHILNLCFPGIKAEVLLHALEREGIYTSPGSACHSRQARPSHVLQALGLREEELSGSLRFSFSAFNTEAQIRRVVRVAAAAVRELSKYGSSV